MADILFPSIPTGSVESTDDEANEAYGKISPQIGAAIGAAFSQSSPIEALQKADQRGSYAGSSVWDQAIHMMGNLSNTAAEGYFPDSLPKAPVQTSQTITPEQTKQYSPDGKPLSAGPIPEDLAKVLGEQKKNEMKQSDILSRFENAHSWPTNFGVGLAGQLLDPLNTASMFVPGLGEERILAQAGAETGFLGRTALRAGAGVSQALTGQLPLTGLKYGLSEETTQDYGIRDAMSDLLYSAVGGAVGFATIGLAHEAGIGSDRVLKNVMDAKNWKEYTNAMAAMNDTLGKGYDALANQPAPVMHYTMSTGIAQLMDGRPVDITPVLNTRLGEQLSKLNDQIEQTQNSIAEVYERAGLTPQLRLREPGVAPEQPPSIDALKSRLAALDKGQETLDNHDQLQSRAENAVAGKDSAWISRARSENARISENPEASPEDVNQQGMYRDQIAKHEADQTDIAGAKLSASDLKTLQESKAEIARIKSDPDASNEDLQKVEGLRQWVERVETKRLADKIKTSRDLDQQIAAHGEAVTKARKVSGYTPDELWMHLGDEEFTQLQSLDGISKQLVKQFEDLQELSSSLKKWDTYEPIPYHEIIEAHSKVNAIFDTVGGDWYKLSEEQREEIEGWERFINENNNKLRELKNVNPADLPKLERYPELPGLPAGKRIEPMLYNSTDFGRIPAGPRKNPDIFNPSVGRFNEYKKPTTLGEINQIIKTALSNHDYLWSPTPADVVAEQKELSQRGFASGVNQNDLQGEVQTLGAVKTPPPIAPVTAVMKPTALNDELEALQKAEHDYGMANVTNPTVEDHQVLMETQKGITDAEAKSNAYRQASDCISEAGV